MRLIAIDTAPGVPTACLLDTGTVRACWSGHPRTSPRAVLEAIRVLLADARLELAELDALACGRGPGAFTGVRLALALAQGLALGTGRPLIAVSDLAALAWRAGRRHGWRRVLACMDARQGEVYWGAYECGETKAVTLAREAIAAPGRVVPPSGPWPVAGSGVPMLAGAGFVASDWDATLVPDAEAVGVLAGPMFAAGLSGRPEEAVPVYLRTRVAAESPGRHNSSVI